MAVPDLWRTQKQRYSLQAEVCPHCTNAVFPPRNVCPYCRQALTAAATPHQVASARPQMDRVRELVYTLIKAPAAGGPTAVAAAGDD